MKSDPIIAKWLRDLKILDQHIYELLWLRFVFKEVQAIIKRKTAIQTDGYFHEFLAVTFSKAASISVRRQLDADRNERSLARLLCEIQQSPHVLTRQRFEYMYTRGQPRKTKSDRMFYDIHRQRARKAFRQFAGKLKTQVDPALVCRDLLRLSNDCYPVRRFVNKRIAHHDRRRYVRKPTFNDLYAAIDSILKIYQKYTHLIRGVPYDITIQPQWDWKQVFKVPWIP